MTGHSGRGRGGDLATVLPPVDAFFFGGRLTVEPFARDVFDGAFDGAFAEVLGDAFGDDLLGDPCPDASRGGATVDPADIRIDSERA